MLRFHPVFALASFVVGCLAAFKIPTPPRFVFGTNY